MIIVGRMFVEVKGEYRLEMRGVGEISVKMTRKARLSCCGMCGIALTLSRQLRYLAVQYRDRHISRPCVWIE